MSRFLLLFLASSCLIVFAEEDVCTDKSSCLIAELDSWFKLLQDKKTGLHCVEDLGEPDETGEKLYTLAKNCDEDGAIWQYKYSGAKGKGRIFHGKGTLHFTKLSTPPHGYDYGMKSGRCLKLSDGNIKSIETVFQEGIPHGDEAEINYFDGTKQQVKMHKGMRHGFSRKYKTVKDKETNVELHEKQLYAVTNYKNGVQFGPEWVIKDNKVNLLVPSNVKSQDALAFVTFGNETKLFAGTLEEEDMMVKVSEAVLTGIKEEYCVKVPQFETRGDVFDYDLQVKGRMKATVAKIIRFFEIVTDESTPLAINYKLDKDNFDAKDAKYLLKMVKDEGQHWSVIVDGEKAKAFYEGGKNKDNLPDGNGNLKILSDIKRSDYLRGEKANKTEEAQSDNIKEFLDSYVPLEMLNMRLKPKQIISIRGFFEQGSLTGTVTVEYADGSTMEGFAVNGALHGIARQLAPPFKKGRRKRYVRRLVENVVISAGMMSRDEPIKEVMFVGSYKNGYIDGPGWKFMVGGTYLFGEFKKSTAFTTNHGAFINQDLESCYFGRFVDGKMMSGQLAHVVGTKSVDKIQVPEFSEPSGTVYRYGVEEKGDTLNDPLVTDVTEDTWVYVQKSDIAGEGLFAKQDIPANTVVAYFGGIRYTNKDWNNTNFLDPNYWLRTDSAEVIYLPEELGQSTDKYRATLAHKINHSFDKWNCMFHALDHPRFGLIPAARTTDHIDKDQEIVCLYELKYEEAAPWYQELWRQEIDNDFVYGPFGHRGSKRNDSEPIQAWLTNATLYNEFHQYAVNVLNLEPVT